MKISFVLMFVILTSSASVWALNFTGHLFRINGVYHIQLENNEGEKQFFQAQPQTSQIESTLRELNSLDMITGTGTIREDKTLVIKSIDFVALRRLLGVWQSPSVQINFVDYQNVTIDFWSRGLNLKAKYNYALSPGNGKSWRMFFTDSDSVTLGVLVIEALFAELEIYDPQTGEIAYRYQLQKSFLPLYAH